MELYAAMVENLDHNVGRIDRTPQADRPLRRHVHPLPVRQRRRGQPDRPPGRERRVAQAPLRQHVANLGSVGSYTWPGRTAGRRQRDAVPALEELPHRGRHPCASDRALRRNGTPRPGRPRRHGEGRRPHGARARGRDTPRHELRRPASRAARRTLDGLVPDGTSTARARQRIQHGLRALRPPCAPAGPLQGRLALRAVRAGALGALRPRGRPARVERPRGLAAGEARGARARVDAYAARAGVVLPTRDQGYALEPAPVESKGRAPEREWRVNSGTADGRRFSPLDQINRENVRQPRRRGSTARTT